MRRRLQFVGVLLRRTLHAAAKDRVTTSAASLAFHGFLAVVTAGVAAVGAISLIGISPRGLARLVHDLQVLIPAQIADTVSAALQATGHSTGGWVAALLGGAVAFWSGLEAMAAMEVGLDVAFEVSGDLGFVGRRLKAVPLVVCTLLLGGAAFALLVLGNPIRSLLPASFALARSTFDALFDLLRWVGALVLVTALLSIFYRYGPNRPERKRWISVGAIVATLGWLGASAAFSFYLSRFGHTSRTYGTFAGVAVLLLWLYLAAMAVMLGAELDRQIEVAASAEAARGPDTTGAAPDPGLVPPEIPSADSTPGGDASSVPGTT